MGLSKKGTRALILKAPDPSFEGGHLIRFSLAFPRGLLSYPVGCLLNPPSFRNTIMRILLLLCGIVLMAPLGVAQSEPTAKPPVPTDSKAVLNKPAAIKAKVSEANAPVIKLAANKADEPEAPKASLAKAVEFLDPINADWTKARKCGTCHTNYPYLMTRRLLPGGSDSATLKEVRAHFEERALNWDKEKPRWDAEVVSTAAALIWDDKHGRTSGSKPAKAAWDRMWKLQKPDGGFEWLKCNWPPAEHDDDYGALVAAMAVMEAPKAWREESKTNIDKLIAHIQSQKLTSLHHELLRGWLLCQLGQPLDKPAIQSLLERVEKVKHKDGGWSLVSLGQWKRHDGEVNDLAKAGADGYGTAIVILTLEGLGVDAATAAAPLSREGRSWLAKHQKTSGRWFVRSPSNDKFHYMTHSGTAWAAYVLNQQLGHIPIIE